VKGKGLKSGPILPLDVIVLTAEKAENVLERLLRKYADRLT